MGVSNSEIISTVGWWQKNPLNMSFQWKSVVTAFENGVSERRNVWSRPIRLWKVNFSEMEQSYRDKVIQFFNEAMGQYTTFLFKDRYDYSATATFTGDGSTKIFQLYKSYHSGAWIETKRDIVTGTVVVKFDGVVQPSGYTVSTTTGVVTFSSAPTLGVVVTIDFEFYFRVAFTQDSLQDSKISPTFFEFGELEITEVL